jgi:hypothetical protein
MRTGKGGCIADDCEVTLTSTNGEVQEFKKMFHGV